MQCDDLAGLHLVQRLPHARTPWPPALNCSPCTLSTPQDGAWVGWWSPHQRILMGEIDLDFDLGPDMRLIDISSQYNLTWIKSETPKTSAVLSAIPATVGLGEIVRSLLGPHRVALLNTGARIGVISLSPETHAVRTRLRQIIDHAPLDALIRPN